MARHQPSVSSILISECYTSKFSNSWKPALLNITGKHFFTFMWLPSSSQNGLYSFFPDQETIRICSFTISTFCGYEDPTHKGNLSIVTQKEEKAFLVTQTRLSIGLNVVWTHIFNLLPVLILTSEKPNNYLEHKHLSSLSHKETLGPLSSSASPRTAWVSLAVTANQLSTNHIAFVKDEDRASKHL